MQSKQDARCLIILMRFLQPEGVVNAGTIFTELTLLRARDVINISCVKAESF